MLGFSYEDRSMYFVDTSGAKIASKVLFIRSGTSNMSPAVTYPPLLLPGRDEDDDPPLQLQAATRPPGARPGGRARVGHGACGHHWRVHRGFLRDLISGDHNLMSVDYEQITYCMQCTCCNLILIAYLYASVQYISGGKDCGLGKML